jgi:tRNA(Ile2) C34 agmatinyltransferase TiaS
MYAQRDPRSLDISLDVRVRTPPKCPDCRTELEESQGFFGRYCWKCVKCDFKKKNKNDFVTVSRSLVGKLRSELKTSVNS